jgi:hypothetical protein
MAESQLVQLQNMRVLLEEARLFTRDLAYHRRARPEARLELALDGIDRQIEDLRATGASVRNSEGAGVLRGSGPLKVPQTKGKLTNTRCIKEHQYDEG